VVLAPRDPSPTGPISRYGYSQTWTGTDCSVHIDDSRDCLRNEKAAGSNPAGRRCRISRWVGTARHKPGSRSLFCNAASTTSARR
jgi:hypothetical protein